MAQRMILVVALAVAGCGSGNGGSCSLWPGDWTGRLTYAWTAPDGTSGSSDLHVTFTISGCGPRFPELNLVQGNVTALAGDVAGLGAAQLTPDPPVCPPSGCAGELHVPIELPPGSAYAGWDWGLNFTGGNVTSAMSTLVFDATGTSITSMPSDATWKAAPDDALRAGLPAGATLTYPSYELSH
ncbi:MAG TPA: hypothetical protein VGL86_02240 [Polyangia bacterium]